MTYFYPRDRCNMYVYSVYGVRYILMPRSLKSESQLETFLIYKNFDKIDRYTHIFRTYTQQFNIRIKIVWHRKSIYRIHYIFIRTYIYIGSFTHCSKFPVILLLKILQYNKKHSTFISPCV